MSGRNAMVVLVASLAGSFALAACGAGSESASGGNKLTLAGARAFDGFPLYWAGEHVDGLPLAAILRRDDTANYVSFVYGECEPAAYDQGCAPPAEVQVWSGDDRSLRSYDAAVPGSPSPEVTTIRGSPAAFLDDGTRLELYLGASTVVIFGDSRARVFVIAQALRCLGGSRGPPGVLDC